MTTPLLEGRGRQEIWTGNVIDCDVHANVPSLDALFPYQEEVWAQFAKDRGWEGPTGVNIAYPASVPTTARPEWKTDGVVPASEVSMLKGHILDPWAVERAIVNCYYSIDSLRHPDWAAALARSVNDWIVAEWLDKDPRLAASMVVPARDPAAAVKEIERVGDHPGFVQVLMPVRSERLYGQRVFFPIYEAMTRHDLVMGLHWGGTPEGEPSTGGFPSWYAEEYAAETQSYGAQITSLIAEGVFQQFPEMRVSVLEGGFTWVPGWGWRMNAEWKGLRREIPWVDRPPMDILRDHFRFSIAPMDAGPEKEMKKILDWLGTEDILMFATDYPHRHDDDIKAFLDILPESMRQRVMSDTARDWYRL